MLHKALVRSHLEYANAVWSPYIYVLEGEQRRATKLLNAIKHLTYKQRLTKLKLRILKNR